jgi:superfamily II DNA or RNA helicase
MQLRNYQYEAINMTRLALSKGAKAPLLVLPTGAGKTVIFSDIAKRAIKKKNKVLILVHRRELITQASKKLTDINVKHGIIAAGFESSDSPLQVASVQTLVRRLDKTHFRPDLIIIDEAHHAVAGSWSKIINHWKSSKLLGVTATPCRLDGRPLKDFFDYLVLGPSIGNLVAQGYLCPHKVFAAPNDLNLSNVKTRAGDYAKDQLEHELKRADITGDAVEQYRKHADGLPAIAFCVSVDHGISVRNKFNNAGYKAGLITGSMNNKDRDEILFNLSSGKIQVLASVDVVNEGFNLPCISAAILLRATKSEGLYLQQVGRILRPQKGKVAIVLDHVGNTFEHGFVDDTRNWSLKSKLKSRKKGDPPPAVQTCKKCFAVFKPQRICPSCGYEPPVNTRELTEDKKDLQELKREQVRERKLKKKEQGSARTLPELLALASKRGYKPGWAYYIFNQRNK